MDDRERLEVRLREWGATDDEIAAAVATGTIGALALELALRRGEPLTLDEAAAASGVEPDKLTELWRAFGLAAGSRATYPTDLVAAMPVMSTTLQWLGADTLLGLGRVFGGATAQIAESIVDSFRTDFELPAIAAGTRYSDVVERYQSIARTGLPAVEELLTALLRAHLVRVAAGSWLPDTENASAHRDLFVGFVDLVGYTALSRTLPPRELAALLRDFEHTVADVITREGGRLVKLIGDGAMFIAESADAGCAIAIGLCQRIAASDQLPPAGVGADAGSVLSLYGDYYGDVVNRAARLVALAAPSTIAVSDAVAARAQGFDFEQLPPSALKGFAVESIAYRLAPDSGVPEG
ncbi:MAG TPA: adenylate/guanylate cyclase domain-containing protein [Mycobacteriales bacterium]|nr:adenylate/guanylate cyclase domain-containing protein [Mycobacteriales bacterium]